MWSLFVWNGNIVVVSHYARIRSLTVLEQGSGNVNYFILMHAEEEVVDGLAKEWWAMAEVMELGKHVHCILPDLRLTLWLTFGLH